MWIGPRRPLVAFWRLVLQSDFKKKPTGKSTRGCRGFIGGLQEDSQRNFGGFEGGKVGGKGS